MQYSSLNIMPLNLSPLATNLAASSANRSTHSAPARIPYL